HTVTINVLLNVFPPVNLTVSEITTSSATFSWEPGGEETSWEVLVLEATLPAPSGETAGIPITATPVYTTTILEPAKVYNFYVRANVESEFSPWNKLKFASGCIPVDLFNENFDTTDFGYLPICWSAIVGGDGISEY